MENGIFLRTRDSNKTMFPTLFSDTVSATGSPIPRNPVGTPIFSINFQNGGLYVTLSPDSSRGLLKTGGPD